jgi:hypothetical protein
MNNGKPKPLTLLDRKQIQFLFIESKLKKNTVAKSIKRCPKVITYEIAKWKQEFKDLPYNAEKAHEVLPLIYLHPETRRLIKALTKEVKQPKLFKKKFIVKVEEENRDKKIISYYKRGYKTNQIARLMKLNFRVVEKICKQNNIKGIETIDPVEAKEWITK